MWFYINRRTGDVHLGIYYVETGSTPPFADLPINASNGESIFTIAAKMGKAAVDDFKESIKKAEEAGIPAFVPNSF